jgi:prepilin-type N-terminal cleavage/methylation domain-containing protein
MSSNQFRRAQSAFTLVEVLVVLAIIGVIAALLFPVLSAAKQRGKVADLTSKFHQAGIASALYAEDWDGAMPFGSSQGTVSSILRYGDRYGEPWDTILVEAKTWPEAIQPYGGNELFVDDLSAQEGFEYRYDDLRAINGFRFSSFENPSDHVYGTSVPIDPTLEPWEWKLVCLFADARVSVENRGRCLSDLDKAMDEYL